MSVLPGAVVVWNGINWIVDTVVGDVATFYEDDDGDHFDPRSAHVTDLQVVDHLRRADGWSQDDPSIWRTT
jgi:hypothetical protein